MAVLIVNYRTPSLTGAAIESVLVEPAVDEVVVVDNASGDDSVARLRAIDDPRVCVVESGENLGFGGGMNLAARHATSEILFLLNSDATLVEGSMTPMTDRLLDAGTGIVAPFVFEHGSGEVQRDSFGVLPSPMTFVRRANVEPTSSLTPDWVSGVAFAITASTFAAVDGFDERFHMYFEDIDLCRRVRAAGLAVVRTRAARVVHIGGASRRSARRKHRQYFRSQLQYLVVSGTPSWQLHLFRLARLPIRIRREVRP